MFRRKRRNIIDIRCKKGLKRKMQKQLVTVFGFSKFYSGSKVLH